MYYTYIHTFFARLVNEDWSTNFCHNVKYFDKIHRKYFIKLYPSNTYLRMYVCNRKILNKYNIIVSIIFQISFAGDGHITFINHLGAILYIYVYVCMYLLHFAFRPTNNFLELKVKSNEILYCRVISWLKWKWKFNLISLFHTLVHVLLKF